MKKLIKADFYCLFKNKIFLFGSFGMLFLNLYIIFFPNIGGSIMNSFEPFRAMVYSPLVMSVIVSVAVSSDRRRKTENNKISSGCKRWQIYLSHFTVCTVAGLIVSSFSVFGAVKLLLVAPVNIKALIFYFVLTFLCLTALISVFVLISILSGSQILSLILCTVLSVFFMFSCSYVDSALGAPEYTAKSITRQTPVLDENGEPTGIIMEEYIGDETELIKNLSYVGGTKRKIYELYLKVCPQTLLNRTYDYRTVYAECGKDDVLEGFEQSFNMNVKSDSIFFVTSFLYIGATAFIGIMLYKRKELR